MSERGAYTDLDSLVRMQYDAFGFSFLPRFAVTSLLSGKHRSKLRGRGLDFEEVRAYQFGDDIRNIDWKVTARTRSTHTKVFTEERERPVLILLDQSTDMFFGSVSATKSVAAAELAALTAWRTLSQGDRVGGIVIGNAKLGGPSLSAVRPRRNRNAVLEFLQNAVEANRCLPAIDPASTPESQLSRGLAEAERTATHDFLVTVITTLGRIDDNAIKAMIRLKRHNDVVLALAFDRMERDLPQSELVVTDGHSQIGIGATDKRLRDAFHRDYVDRLASLNDRMRGYGIPVFSFDTERGVAEQLRRALGH